MNLIQGQGQTVTLLSYPQSSDAATQSDDREGKQTRIPSQVHAAHEEVVESAVRVRERGSQHAYARPIGSQQ